MTLSTFLSILVGAALTLLAGLIGAYLESRREHKRWLRDKRMEAYLALLEVMSRHQAVLGLTADDDAEPKLWQALTEVQAPLNSVALLGPPRVVNAASVLTNEFTEWIKVSGERSETALDHFKLVRQMFTLLATEVLGVQGAPFWKRRKIFKRVDATLSKTLASQRVRFDREKAARAQRTRSAPDPAPDTPADSAR